MTIAIKRMFVAAVALLCLTQAVIVSAQQVTDPQLLDAFKKIRTMGPFLNPMVIQQTGALFAEIHKTTDKSGVKAFRDLRYGPDEKRNLLDVYTPEHYSGTRPAVVYIHGGGLTGGYKDNAASDLMYANIGTYFARHDMVGINATYRLVPNIVFPQGAQDMQARDHNHISISQHINTADDRYSSQMVEFIHDVIGN